MQLLQIIRIRSIIIFILSLCSLCLVGHEARASAPTLSEEKFNALLQLQIAHPEKEKEIEQFIYAHYGRPLAVLVLDSSDFTKKSLKSGAVQARADILKQDEIATLVINFYGGKMLLARADSVNAIFPTVNTAMLAAKTLLHLLQQQGLDASIGIGFGPLIPIGKHDIYGREADIAFQLGEFLSEKGNILLSTNAKAHLIGTTDEWTHKKIEKEGQTFEAYQRKIPAPDFTRPPKERTKDFFVGLLQWRNEHPDQHSKVDAYLEKYFSQPVALLALFDHMSLSEKLKSSRFKKNAQTQALLKIALPIIKAENGQLLLRTQAEDGVFSIFPSVQAALACSEKLMPVLLAQHISVAIGIGHGRVFGLDVMNFFGQEVNISAKLAKNAEQAGQIWMTKAAKEQDKSFNESQWLPQNISISGNLFEAYLKK